MVIDVRPHEDGIDDEWHALAARAGAGPFARPDWMRAWWAAFGGPGPMRLLTVRDRGALRALIPLAFRRGSVRYPANDHTPFVSILADGIRPRAVAADGLMRLNALDIRVPELRSDGDSLRELTAAAGRHGYRIHVRPAAAAPYLDLDGIADPLACLSAKRAKDLRRLRRRLAEAGDLRVRVHTRSDGLGAKLDEAFATEALQWKGAAGTAIRSSAVLDGFYRRVAVDAARRGSLRLVYLELDGRVVSFGLGLRIGGVSYALKAGFDPRFARYSPGHLLIAEELRQALVDGGGRFEFLGNSEPYKLAWTRDVNPHSTLYAARPGVGGAVAYLAHRARGSASRVVPRLRRTRRA